MIQRKPDLPYCDNACGLNDGVIKMTLLCGKHYFVGLCLFAIMLSFSLTDVLKHSSFILPGL